MDSAQFADFRRRQIDLPGQSGAVSAIEMGPAEQPLDIIFSHANGFNARTYRTILGPLARTHRLMIVDQRGHGLCTLPADPATQRDSWRDVADDLTSILDAIDARNVVLAGHSMGGAISLLAAAARPSRVRALGLFDPVVIFGALATEAGPDSRTESPLIQGALRRRSVFANKAAVMEAYRGRGAFRTWSEPMLADYVADGFVKTSDGQVTLACQPAWEASNFMAHANDLWPAFATVKAPIAILRAEVGSTCRIEDRQTELNVSGTVRIETIPGTSHFLPMERPDLVVETLGSL